MTRARGVADYGYYPPVNNNILINPSFTVKQRGDVIDHNTASYGPDRWQIRGLNQVGGTMSQSTTVVDDATGINKLVVKHSGATNEAYLYQRIEAVNIQGLYGKEMTFSFGYSDVGGSGVPKVKIEAWGSSATLKLLYNAVPTSLGDNRWTCTFTLSTADGTIPDPNEIGMQVVIYANEANNAPDEWSVWETKLEVGSVVTPFIARPYSEELALCQRYCIVYAEGTALAGNAANPTEFQARFQYLAVMRVSPSASIVSGTSYRISDDFASDQVAPNLVVGIIKTSNMGCRLTLGGFSGLTEGRTYAGVYTVLEDAKIMFDAEL